MMRHGSLSLLASGWLMSLGAGTIAALRTNPGGGLRHGEEEVFHNPFGAGNNHENRDQIPIPIGHPSESHEEGRMLFNIPSILEEAVADHDGNNFGASEDIGPWEGLHSGPTDRVVGGSQANVQQPWFGLTMTANNGSYYRGPCGATLISRRWAVTAAHCLSNNRKNDMIDRIDAIYVGAYSPWQADRFGNGNGGKPYEIIRIKSWHEHPYHMPGPASQHDIALLELERDVSYNFPGFYHMNLPCPNFQAYLQPYQDATIYGFGDTSYGGSNSKVIKQANVRYEPWNSCHSKMRKWGLSPDMICFGGDGYTDACSGDSGGPVIARNTLAGVTSWGYRCAAPGYPGVYSNVEVHLDWINLVTGGVGTNRCFSNGYQSGGYQSGGYQSYQMGRLSKKPTSDPAGEAITGEDIDDSPNTYTLPPTSSPPTPSPTTEAPTEAPTDAPTEAPTYPPTVPPTDVPTAPWWTPPTEPIISVRSINCVDEEGAVAYVKPNGKKKWQNCFDIGSNPDRLNSICDCFQRDGNTVLNSKVSDFCPKTCGVKEC